jgi:hypothetical protein
MSENKDRIDSILDQVQPERRTFLKRLVGGGALAVLALPASGLLAQPGQDGDGKGKGDGEGKGKGKGKGNGKGKGKGEE